jgi:phage shock protein A
MTWYTPPGPGLDMNYTRALEAQDDARRARNVLLARDEQVAQLQANLNGWVESHGRLDKSFKALQEKHAELEKKYAGLEARHATLEATHVELQAAHTVVLAQQYAQQRLKETALRELQRFDPKNLMLTADFRKILFDRECGAKMQELQTQQPAAQQPSVKQSAAPEIKNGGATVPAVAAPVASAAAPSEPESKTYAFKLTPEDKARAGSGWFR